MSTPGEVRSAVDIATRRQLTPTEAECLNYAAGRLEKLDCHQWREPEEMWDRDGNSSIDAYNAKWVTENFYNYMSTGNLGLVVHSAGSNWAFQGWDPTDKGDGSLSSMPWGA